MKLQKAMALGMASVMTVSLAACGSATTSTDTTTEAAATTTATTEKATETTVAEPESTGELSYQGVTLGENIDLTASIKWIHHKTDREEDGC